MKLENPTTFCVRVGKSAPAFANVAEILGTMNNIIKTTIHIVKIKSING